MKYKMLALMLALTVASWAQTSTQTAPSAPQQNTAPADKAKCACCDKMAGGDSKDASASCMRHKDHADSKEMGSCCGKDAKSCMKGDKDKTAASCCKEGCGKDKTAAACCGGNGKDCGKDCCSSKKTEKAAKSCCRPNAHS